MKRQSSVARFIIVALVTCIVAYAVILLTGMQIGIKNGLLKMSQEQIRGMSAVTVKEINSILETLEKCNNYVVDSYPIYRKNRPETYAADLTDECAKYFGTAAAVIVDANGNQLSPESNGVIEKKDLMQKALAGIPAKDLVNIGKEDVHAIFATPLKEDGKVIGAIVVRANTTNDEMVKLVAEETGYDITIFGDRNKRVYTSMQGLKGTRLDDMATIDKVMAGGEELTTRITNGKKNIAYYYPLKDASGNVLTTLYMGKAYEEVDKIASDIFATVLAIALACTIAEFVIILVILLLKVIRPLKIVGNAIANLSSGDADLTIQLPVHGTDEFAKLCTDVNTFISMLRTIMKELNVVQQAIVSLVADLGSSSQQSASATAEILANIESVRHQSQEQTEAVTGTTKTLHNSEESAVALNHLIENQSAATTESSAAIEEMLGNIKSVSASVHKMTENFHVLENVVQNGSEKLSHVNEKITQISEESKMLMQANDMIAQIASQTNLLAMNAAIEAAHAGDAGKGFSVVADEIRKLAENSSSQSDTISKELNNIASSITGVVSLSGEAQSAFGEIVQHIQTTDTIINQINSAMTEQETASQQIFEALSDTRNMAVDVTEKAHEMSDAVDSVSKDMSTVQQISDTISGSMDEMAIGAQQISQSSQTVQELAHQTQESIDTMDGHLKKFKV